MPVQDNTDNTAQPSPSPMGGGRERAAGAGKVGMELYLTFFRIGLFTLGGGYAMIPLIEREVVDRHHWVSREELLDLIAVAQSCPGVFAINISTFIGYKLLGNRGAVYTSIATALPSFLVILLIAMFFRTFKDNHLVEAVFCGIRPAVVALIAAPTFDLARSAHIRWANAWIPVASAVAIWAFGVSPIVVILIAGVGGFVYGRYVKPAKP